PLRSIAMGAGIAFAIQFAGKVVGYLLQIVLARWIGPAEYGIFNYVLAWVSVLAVVGGLGFPEAILRFIPEYKTVREWSYLRGVMIRSRQFTLLVSIALGVLFVLVASLLNGGNITQDMWPFYLGGFMIPIMALFNLLSETFRAMHRVAFAYAPRQILEPLLLIGAILGMALVGMSTIQGGDALLADLLILLALVVAQLWVLWRAMPPEARESSPAYQGRLWLGISLPMLLVAGYRILLNRTDILLLGAFVTPADLGVYNAALVISGSVSFVLVAVNTVFAPTVAAMYKRNDLAGLQRLVTVTAHWSFWPSLLLGLFLVFFAEPLLALLGRDFTAGRTAMLIMIVGHLINSGVGSVGYLLNMTGHQKYTAKVFGWTSVLSLFLYGGLIYLMGALGAAIASSTVMAIRNLWLYYYVVTQLKIYPSVLDALRVAGPAEQQ
ncbi:MAG: oligosaccharide flippase family protein, partial [Caldilineaceae bacterium]|nr:oligosaccharide flippase family protein [Caldilineaceae bacterium]